MAETANNKQHIYAYDVLRILSAFMVVVIHTTTKSFQELPLLSGSWTAVMTTSALAHAFVPIFVMISGALFLSPDRKIDTASLWMHNILRMAIVLFVWSFAYGLYDFLQYKASLKFLVWETLDGRNHLWFLRMLIGIYVILPILAVWVRNASAKSIQYFLLLFFAFEICAETLIAFSTHEVVQYALNVRNFPLVCSYAGYFMLGYYLIHVGLSAKAEKVFGVLTLLSLPLSALMSYIASSKRGIPYLEASNSFCLPTFFLSAGLFYFIFKFCSKKTPKAGTHKILKGLGADTLGIYLIHIGVMEQLARFDINWTKPGLFIGLLGYTLVVFLISLGISALLRRIPLIGKYIC